uniref:EF-hand domain-containing protein n=1 Tax=Haptolina brevifila TaxID=156173 RepID=A0A7S2J6P2_9EUKA
MVHFAFTMPAADGTFQSRGSVYWKLGGPTSQVSYTFPSAAVRADDGSGPWIGIVSRGASCINLVNPDAWYRATVKRSTGFVWVDGIDSVEIGSTYDMVMVPCGGTHGGEIGRITFQAASAAPDSLEGVSDSDYTHIRAAFRVFDVDDSGTLSASELRAILSRGPNPMLSPDEVNEVIDSFDASGDGHLSIHEFAKACFELSDEEAEALQAKLDEADAARPPTVPSLRRQLARLSTDGAGVLDQKDIYLKCMQLELLTYLSTGGDSTNLVTSGVGTELLTSAVLLETFLSAGTCDQVYGWGFGGVVYYHENGSSSGTSDKSKETVHERWAEAFKVLLRIGEKYEDIIEGGYPH